MTTGQLLFYGGAALLAMTVLLAIIFIIKKPKYTPSRRHTPEPIQAEPIAFATGTR